jgi:hypothetical protein
MKRELDWELRRNLPSKVYVNLNNHLLSVTQEINKSWLVVGHTANLVLRHPRFVVSEQSRQRVIQRQRKSVHAWALGTLISVDLPNLPPLAEICYDPYNQDSFTWRDTGVKVVGADLLVAIDNKVYCSTESQTAQLKLF